MADPDLSQRQDERQRLQALERENQLLRLAIDESPDVILLKDAKGDFLLCNKTLAELYGVQPHEMVGKSDGDFSATPEQDAFFRDNVLSIMRSGVTQVVMEETTDDKSGEVRYFKSIKKPFRNKDGEACILVIAHDVTDIRVAQARAEASERQLQHALHATGEGLWDWHIDSGQLVHNSRWYDLLGYARQDMRGHVEDFLGLLHPEEKAEVQQRIEQSLQHGVPYHHEHRMRHRDGHWIWVLDRGEVTERDANGRPLRMVGSFSNIQQRKQVELDLVQAKQEAEAASKAKSVFLANMSHEIRTPLHGVVGTLSLLQASGLNPQQQQLAQLVEQSAQALTRLIDEILDLSKIEAGKLELRAEPVQVRQLVADCIQLFDSSARAKGLSLQAHIDPSLPSQLQTDGHRLRQVLHNLIHNAIKFTDAGHVALRLSAEQGHWIGEVTDTGIGVASEHQDTLFRPFSQIDGSSTRHHGGTGLGLSICKRLVNAMGGSIGVDSPAGGGSRFWFRLPLVAPPFTAAHTPVAAHDALTGAEALPRWRVLVVEDHPLNQRMIMTMLDTLGMIGTLVDNGLSALQILRDKAFDLVFMDCQMPVMDGYDTVQRIRAGEAGAQAARSRIVALTANAMPEDLQRCAQVGFDRHIAKPATLDVIRQAIVDAQSPTWAAR